MKSVALVCAIAAASLGFSSLSFAQEYERHGSEHQAQHPMKDKHDASPRGMNPHGSDPRNAPNDRQFGARSPEFHRGGRIPGEYRNHEYVVDDWRAHHLTPPPRGHHWVQVGADYVLVAIATGIIAQLVLSQ